MYYSDYQMGTLAGDTHRHYIAEAETYRKIHKSQAAGSVSAAPGTRGILVRLGTALIALGRNLCERRGSLQVEIAYRIVPDQGARHARHVA
jgi:hypothetical protein